MSCHHSGYLGPDDSLQQQYHGLIAALIQDPASLGLPDISIVTRKMMVTLLRLQQRYRAAELGEAANAEA